MRFYNITGGRILLDGMDARQICIDDLRRQFAVVPQELVLFARSVRDNIAYGRPEASSEDIIAAAVAANAHEFIMRMSNGYDTVVGEVAARCPAGSANASPLPVLSSAMRPSWFWTSQPQPWMPSRKTW